VRATGIGFLISSFLRLIKRDTQNPMTPLHHIRIIVSSAENCMRGIYGSFFSIGPNAEDLREKLPEKPDSLLLTIR
jgi:hypothetical protein